MTGESGERDADVSPEEHAVLERVLLGDITPEEAAERIGDRARARSSAVQPPDEAPGEDPAARLVAEIARDVEAEEAVAPRPAVPWRKVSALAGAGIGALALAAVLNGEASQDHALTALLVAVGALVFYSLLGIPLGLLPYRRPLVPPAAVGGAAVILAWGLLLAATDNWSAYVPSVFYVGFVVSLVVAGAGAMQMARRAERTFDLIHRRRK